MRREGSPWQGLGTVVVKELADHFDSARMPLLALLKVAPAAATLAPMRGVEETTILAAYLAAGAIIGYLLDRNFVWTFLITYIAAHAVMGWSFGPWPYSMLAAMASFYARRAMHRRRLILMEA